MRRRPFDPPTEEVRAMLAKHYADATCRGRCAICRLSRRFRRKEIGVSKLAQEMQRIADEIFKRTTPPSRQQAKATKKKSERKVKGKRR